MKFFQFILKLVLCKPVLQAIAGKLDGYKTVLGFAGSGLLAVVYFIYTLFPDMVDPSVVDPETVHTALEAAIGSFLALAFGGMGHKVIKKKRKEASIEQELEELRKKIQEYEQSNGTITSNYMEYEQH